MRLWLLYIRRTTAVQSDRSHSRENCQASSSLDSKYNIQKKAHGLSRNFRADRRVTQQVLPKRRLDEHYSLDASTVLGRMRYRLYNGL